MIVVAGISRFFCAVVGALLLSCETVAVRSGMASKLSGSDGAKQVTCQARNDNHNDKRNDAIRIVVAMMMDDVCG
ncbi:hypothetical protein [Novipirellula sp.]|uniref:hypothetical protein n=1 Tax=Novipirellula sp. TaxID=2795430 RepID=UPI003565E54D